MPKKRNTQSFIAQAIAIHGDRYDYSKLEYNPRKILIICKHHGEFLQTPSDHLRGTNCPKCKRRLTPNEVREKCITVHGATYDYSKTDFADTNLLITCPVHGEFTQLTYDHLNGHGCKKCGYELTKATLLSRYGEDNPMKITEFKDKQRGSVLESYGVSNPLKSAECRERARETNLLKYGVEYPMQSPEVFGKSNKIRKKRFILPSGEEVFVQGYEPYAIEALLNAGYSESDILVKHRKSFRYEFEGKTKTYHPDIVIKSESRVIEVKSSYTLKLDTRLNLKRKAVESAGFIFDLWVLSTKGQRLDVVEVLGYAPS